VLLLGVVLLAWPGGSDGPRLLAPPGRPDPVPVGPVITKVPKDCGVSADTLHRLTLGTPTYSGEIATCWWHSVDGYCPDGWCRRKPGDRERAIRVDLQMLKEPADALVRFSSQESPSDLPPDSRDAQPKTVVGLGDEAVAYYSTDRSLRGTLIVFRTANVVARVRYYGVNSTRQDLVNAISQQAATDGALRVASDVAKGLGAAAHPAVATSAASATKPSIQHYPELCDTVPTGLRRLLVPKATPQDDSAFSDLLEGVHGGSAVACEWTSMSGKTSRTLRVVVGSVPDWRPGAGTSAASRDYLRLHYTERAHGQRFEALTGPGEQAFSAYYDNHGEVVFRVRNALVHVQYSADPYNAISADRAVKGAYTTATYVAGALRG
jgi:hypothetical protein